MLLRAQQLLSAGKLFISRDVDTALRHGKPIVALESTIISHGMPFPKNVDCALEVEQAIRTQGVTPATIALINGSIRIGLEEQELIKFGELASDKQVMKASTRDIPSVLAYGKSAGTTVAATISLASMVGIPIFATGGIGGVHREAYSETSTLDVSADLVELSKTGMMVVCSGVKSILDIARTLEFLETQGVAVGSLGCTEFPAFFSNESGIQSPLCVDSLDIAAHIGHINSSLGKSSFLLAVQNPNPMQASRVNTIIQDSLVECNERGVAGKDITPFLLQRINQLTDGESLASNVALIKHNAGIAAQIAKKVYNIKITERPKKRVWVVGGANEDITIKPMASQVLKTSNSANMFSTVGGVALNMSSVLAKLVHVTKVAWDVVLVSALGKDSTGTMILNHLSDLKINSSFIKVLEQSSGRYIEEVNSQGELRRGHVDVSILESLLPNFVSHLEPGDIVLLDGNLSPAFYDEFFKQVNVIDVTIIFEPTSVGKATRILPHIDKVTLVTPNELEVEVFREYANQESSLKFDDWARRGISLLIKRGPLSPVAHMAGEPTVNHLEYPSIHSDLLVNTKGCGDTFTAAFVFSKYLMHQSTEESLLFATRCAQMTAQTRESFPQNFESALQHMPK